MENGNSTESKGNIRRLLCRLHHARLLSNALERSNSRLILGAAAGII